MTKGTRVRVKISGKRGVVVGNLSGFVLVLLDGQERDYGYWPTELDSEEAKEHDIRS